MKNENDYPVGYETIRQHWKEAQGKTPKGISISRKGNSITVFFDIGGKRKNRGLNCEFTYVGIDKALDKCKLISEKLKSCTSLVEFDKWHKDVILEASVVRDDTLTFGEAIKRVEAYFWKGKRRGKKDKPDRDKSNDSDKSSYYNTYGHFYALLPPDKRVNLDDILAAIATKEEGTKQYGYAVNAFRKLAELAKYKHIWETLKEIDTTQTKFRKMQAITLDSFLEWRDKALGITAELHPNADIETRQSWLWVFSMQIAYGMRISEVFAVKNLYKPYKTKGGYTFQALNDPSNKTYLVYIGDKTVIGTTVKTGSRASRPLCSKELFDKLDLTNPKLPTNRPKPDSKPESKASFFGRNARQALLDWNAPFTQTHADRHLCNILGAQEGHSTGVRAKNLGHSENMNEFTYLRSIADAEMVKYLLTDKREPLDILAGINAAKILITKYPQARFALVELISMVYQRSEVEIESFFE